MSALYIAGFGCRRGCGEMSLRELLDAALQEHGLSIAQINGLATIDTKQDEPGLIALAANLGLPLNVLSATQLAAYEARLSNCSEPVLAATGVAGIAEAAALAYAELLAATKQHGAPAAELIIEKRKNADATVALARVFLSNEKSRQRAPS